MTNQINSIAIAPAYQTVGNEKTFHTLRAKFALVSHILFRSNPEDGDVIYFAGRWGQLREFRDLASAGAFLNQIGGK
jgi:hypothetical protein